MIQLSVLIFELLFNLTIYVEPIRLTTSETYIQKRHILVTQSQSLKQTYNKKQSQAEELKTYFSLDVLCNS